MGFYYYYYYFFIIIIIISIFIFLMIFYGNHLNSVCYLYDFVVRDIEIAVYLESPRKINFNLVTFFVSEISQKLFLTIIDKVAIYLDL